MLAEMGHMLKKGARSSCAPRSYTHDFCTPPLKSSSLLSSLLVNHQLVIYTGGHSNNFSKILPPPKAKLSRSITGYASIIVQLSPKNVLSMLTILEDEVVVWQQVELLH